ncbi:hypothetical protein ACIBH1_34615 [Nonomuraea sp. NPDC050663]|uniref:hypothetical protein n=1 Tax=Nonomuraea sp. NPDC050663 TaxID=3364370 RepID=UPI0037AFA2FB
MTGNSYAAVLRTPGIGVWSAVMVCQRFPVAMAPLALVFLGHAVTGSYAVGALLGGAHALAEALAAGPLGRRFDVRPARGELARVLSAEAAVFAALAVAAPALTAAGASPWATVGMIVPACLGGGVSAGAHGGLRAYLVRLAPAESRVPALSLESTTSTIVWTAAPALVAGLAVIDARIPIAAMAALAAAGAVLARRLRDLAPAVATGQASEEAGGGTAAMAAEEATSKRSDEEISRAIRTATSKPSGLWRSSWPAMAYDGAVMFAFGAVSLALPVLLTDHGAEAGLSGLVLTSFALAGIVGGLLYGVRVWPGTPLRHAVLFALGLSVSLVAAALVPVLGAVVMLLALAGFFETPALTARAAALQDVLPESSWAAGFSALYGAAGLGYGAAGLAVAWLIERVPAQVALGICVVTAVAVALASTAMDVRRLTPTKA